MDPARQTYLRKSAEVYDIRLDARVQPTADSGRPSRVVDVVIELNALYAWPARVTRTFPTLQHAKSELDKLFAAIEAQRAELKEPYLVTRLMESLGWHHDGLE